MTKCGALEGFTREDWSKKGVIGAVENSLRLLRTDHVEVVFLHSCSAEVLRRGDCIEGLIRAEERGMTRFVGYSGDNDAAEYALALDFFDVLETSVSIADQAAIPTTIKRASELGVGVVAKRPVANVAWRYDDEPGEAYHVEYWKRLRKLDYPFLHRTREEAVATAARFVLSIDGVATAIIGSTNPENVRRNVRNSAGGPLAPDEFGAIRDRWNEVAADDWAGMT
jgi:aryl-alcohol dehydrogenase-like predicted oxidoreductase